MRVLRGRAADVDADRAATRRLTDEVAASGEPAVRVWRPRPQVAFGRRDARAAGYERARAIARERGYEPVERRTGGRAVAYTGETVSFVRVQPTDEERTGIQARYERTLAAIEDALAALGVATERGEPPAAFCPGTHSLQAAGGKVVGLAQRLGGGTATVGGLLLVRDHAAVAAVLEPVYAALDVPFDPDAVGSLARAGSEVPPARARSAVERALAGETGVAVERVGERA
ncbi:MAG: biotin/lipoate A/B protein ligase family protein [Haloarculaceae archaeon]